MDAAQIWYVSHRPDLVLLAPCDSKEPLPEGSMFVSVDHLHPPEAADAKWRHPKHGAYLTCYGEPAHQRPRVVRCACSQSPCLVRSQRERAEVSEGMIPKDWATTYAEAESYKPPEHRREAAIRTWLDCTGQADKELAQPEEAEISKAAAKMFTARLKGRVCYACELPSTAMKSCGRCGQARYCSRDCQERDWKAHKAACIARQPAGGAVGASNKLGSAGAAEADPQQAGPDAGPAAAAVPDVAAGGAAAGSAAAE